VSGSLEFISRVGQIWHSVANGSSIVTLVRNSIKEVCSRGMGGGMVVQCGHFSDKGSSDADICTFWNKKLRIFRNLWCIRTDKGKGSIFSDLVRTSFLDGALRFGVLQRVSTIFTSNRNFRVFSKEQIFKKTY